MKQLATLVALVLLLGAPTVNAQPTPQGYRSGAILISEFDNCQDSSACRNAPAHWDLDLHMARIVVGGQGPWQRCAHSGGSARWTTLTQFDHRQIICRDVDT